MSDLFSPPLHVNPPACDCKCPGGECINDVVIECESCGQRYSSGGGHECGSQRAVAQIEAHELKRYRRIEMAAIAALRAHGDCSTSDFFFDMMINLGKAVEK